MGIVEEEAGDILSAAKNCFRSREDCGAMRCAPLMINVVARDKRRFGLRRVK